MPIIKSAKKRVRVARKATVRNVKTKRVLRQALKSFQEAVTGGKKSASEALKAAQSALDKSGKKNVMHKNKVARKQRQLAAAAKAAGVKPTASAKKTATPKKTTAKKAAPAKKSSAKKPAAKKTTSKKK